MAGTPQTCLEKIAFIKSKVHMNHFAAVFKYGGMPIEVAVQPEEPAGRGDLGRGGVRARPCRRRVTGDDPGDHERQDYDARDHQDRGGDPAHDIDDQLPVGLRL